MFVLIVLANRLNNLLNCISCDSITNLFGHNGIVIDTETYNWFKRLCGNTKIGATSLRVEVTDAKYKWNMVVKFYRA